MTTSVRCAPRGASVVTPRSVPHVVHASVTRTATQSATSAACASRRSSGPQAEDGEDDDVHERRTARGRKRLSDQERD